LRGRARAHQDRLLADGAAPKLGWPAPLLGSKSTGKEQVKLAWPGASASGSAARRWSRAEAEQASAAGLFLRPYRHLTQPDRLKPCCRAACGNVNPVWPC